MAITLNSVITNLNTYLGDTTTDRISDTERYQALTEATTWLQEELGNEHMINTYELEYVDTVNYYKVTSELGDLLIGADLRKESGSNYQSFSRKSPREISEEISTKEMRDPSWAVERRDGDVYLVVNFNPENSAYTVENFDNIDNWYVNDESDAVNLTLDTIEFKQGNGCAKFDVDVSNYAVDYAEIFNEYFDVNDLSQYEDIGNFLFEVYIPDATYTSSITLLWGEDTSNYWSATVTTDINGNDFTDGWNTIRIKWGDSSVTGTPDSSAIELLDITINYTSSQADDTGYRIDYIRIVNPEILTFHYVSWNVGTNSSGTSISAYTATTDVPFYSGQYDQYRYAVAHKAASILYYSALRNPEQGAVEESEALKSLRRYQKNFESSKTREIKSFKVFGNNLRRGNRRR